ncbi:hypothetical protein [Corallococcus exercitus]|uniref:hypothetical protein n=1 Tax=Corallococcus exercitus TaxID=2316736 RepID=UPI0035D413FA
MPVHERRSLAGSTRRMLGLLALLLTACHSEPGGGGEDAGTPPGEDAGVPLTTVTRDARLLHVDESQTFLISLRKDGTYAQSLPAGEPVRIADAVEAAYGASDGSSAVLWSEAVGGLRKVWLWRPGASDLIPLTSSARGGVLHDRALSYVAFLEEGENGARSVRVARMATCAPGACVPSTPVQAQGADARLWNGGGTLFLLDGMRATLIDAASDTVSALGTLPAAPVFSPGGTRYGWAVDNHVVLFDTATGAQLWDHVWRDEEYQPGWLPAGAPMMLDEVHVLVNTQGPYRGAPQGVPLGHSLSKCTSSGCTVAVSKNECWPERVSGQPAIYCREELCPFVRCDFVNSYRDSAAAWLFKAGESDTWMGPVFSQGFLDAARLKPQAGTGFLLEWSVNNATSKLLLQGPQPTQPFLFTPEPKRLLYRQAVQQADGTPVDHLWTWDREKVVDLGWVEGTPAESGILRDQPPTLYLDVRQPRPDGTHSLSILRVPL